MLSNWLIDRSRYTTGLQDCQMKRFLQYHALNGYGFLRKGSSMPLAAGIYVHEGLAGVLEACKGKEDSIDVTSESFRAIVRPHIQKQIENYKKLVSARGFLNLEGNEEEIAHIINEQATLVEGLIWGFIRTQLPALLANFLIVDVEREEGLDLGEGIYQMSRPDFILRRKADWALTLWDFKTRSMLNEGEMNEYRSSVQFAAGTLAVEKRLGAPVNHYYVQALIKGQRKPEYDVDRKEYCGPRRQSSLLCYGFYKPANPPVEDADWKPKFKYVDNEGRNRTVGKVYVKTPVWAGDFEGRAEGQSNVEHWVWSLPIETLHDLFVQIGPFERQEVLIKEYVEEVVSEEKRWINRLWELYETADEWGGDLYESKLRELVPRSWDCWKFGSPCPYVPICFKHKGWRDPLGSGLYVLRRPHHQPEIDQMLERGLVVPSPEVEEEGEEE